MRTGAPDVAAEKCSVPFSVCSASTGKSRETKACLEQAQKGGGFAGLSGSKSVRPLAASYQTLLSPESPDAVRKQPTGRYSLCLGMSSSPLLFLSVYAAANRC